MEAPRSEGREDLRLELRVKNSVLWHAIYDRYESISNFCRQMHQYGFKFRPSDIGDLINFKASPLDRGGEYSERCLDLESALGIDVEELFPRELYEKIKVSKQVIEIDSVAALPTVVRRHMEALPAPAEESPVVRAIASELREQLERALKTLKHREREVLRLRYGIDCEPHTLEQVGKIFNVSKEVIRQVEMRAIRKLQHPSRARKIEYL